MGSNREIYNFEKVNILIIHQNFIAVFGTPILFSLFVPKPYDFGMKDR